MKPLLNKKIPKRRSVGRPRTLSVDSIIEAASQIPSDELSMTTVARQLNVGVATLYGYIDGIDQLMDLVAQKRGELQLLQDRQQSWQQLVREHATQSFNTLLAFPELVVQLMYRGSFTAAEADYMEQYLTLLKQRGMEPDLALTLYHETNKIVLGAVVTATYLRNLETSGSSQRQIIEAFLQEKGSEMYPLIRSTLKNSGSSKVLSDFNNALERLIADVAQQLNKT